MSPSSSDRQDLPAGHQSDGGQVAEVLVLTAWMVPAALAGYIVSRYTNRFLNRRRLRFIALAASGFGAVLLVGRLLLG